MRYRVFVKRNSQSRFASHHTNNLVHQLKFVSNDFWMLLFFFQHLQNYYTFHSVLLFKGTIAFGNERKIAFEVFYEASPIAPLISACGGKKETGKNNKKKPTWLQPLQRALATLIKRSSQHCAALPFPSLPRCLCVCVCVHDLISARRRWSFLGARSAGGRRAVYTALREWGISNDSALW